MDYSERIYLTTEHPSSNYGIPVLVDRETGQAFGRGDLIFVLSQRWTYTRSLRHSRHPGSTLHPPRKVSPYCHHSYHH